MEVYDPCGCSFCLGSGYRGRIGLFEALWITRDLSQVIAEGGGESRIRDKARKLTSLWQDGCTKVLAGEVSLFEIMHLRPEEV